MPSALRWLVPLSVCLTACGSQNQTSEEFDGGPPGADGDVPYTVGTGGASHVDSGRGALDAGNVADAGNVGDGGSDVLTLYATAGQSNDSGQGDYAALPPDQRPLDPRWTQWIALADPWNVFPTVWSVGGPIGREPKAAYFGPELYMGYTLADSGKHVGIVKYAHGGRALAKYWLPGQEDYPVLIQVIHDATAKLDAAGIRWRWGGLAWVGSEGDGGNVTWSADWTPNFETFEAAVRADLGVPDLPIYFSRLCPAMTLQYFQTVYDQETAYPATHPHTFMVDTDDLTVKDQGVAGPPNNIHYDTPAQVELGKRIARAILAN